MDRPRGCFNKSKEKSAIFYTYNNLTGRGIILPAIVYTLKINHRTGKFYRINKVLIFTIQLLTIVSITIIYKPSIYFWFIYWVGIWSTIFYWIVVLYNIYIYIYYITDFLSKGVEELISKFINNKSAAGYISTIIIILYFLSIWALKKVRSSTILYTSFWGLLADYIGIIFWVRFLYIPGLLKLADIICIPISRAFYLIQLLTAQACQFPLKKPFSFYWDFFLFNYTTFITGVVEILFSNRLTPIYIDFLTVYKTELYIIPTKEGKGAEIQHPIINITIGSISSNSIIAKAIYLTREDYFIQYTKPLLKLINIAACITISQTITVISFPVLIIALILFRVWVISKWFSQNKISILNNITANNKAVLSSFGKALCFPGETTGPQEYKLKYCYLKQKKSVSR
ncbi:hypothetical protein BO99DRAFT_427561 [Aspergillus violaceofuscus CBS 115571]|uniref:Transmembrane protein n=1 Tax=Aspergillus violaceofuscus (strain CBS 115571) TaxID=1450538 RepID=A0A2V5HZA4_ASPV1|nr:hypothetical protein BO99DRAFT_427561 [Aspergillus violaceofuscus CBS 115571]